MCAVLGRFCPGVKVSMIAVRVPRPFPLARPRRPRLGMSDRRASSLRAASLLPPQQPVTTFFPWTAARPFLAQDKKVVPWLPSTACRPLRGAGRPPPVCRQPSRPRWARPGKL